MFEFEDKKYKFTLILRKVRGKTKYSGMIRITDTQTGETSLQIASAIDNSMAFDDIEFMGEFVSQDAELGLVQFDADYGMTVV